METKNKDFQLFKALEISGLIILVMFIVFFMVTMMTIINAFQNEIYSSSFADLNSIQNLIPK